MALPRLRGERPTGKPPVPAPGATPTGPGCRRWRDGGPTALPWGWALPRGAAAPLLPPPAQLPTPGGSGRPQPRGLCRHMPEQEDAPSGRPQPHPSPSPALVVPSARGSPVPSLLGTAGSDGTGRLENTRGVTGDAAPPLGVPPRPRGGRSFPGAQNPRPGAGRATACPRARPGTGPGLTQERGASAARPLCQGARAAACPGNYRGAVAAAGPRWLPFHRSQGRPGQAAVPGCRQEGRSLSWGTVPRQLGASRAPLGAPQAAERSFGKRFICTKGVPGVCTNK